MVTTEELAGYLYPVERDHALFPLWSLGQMLILFGMMKPELRIVTFHRLQTLLRVHGII